MNFVNPDVLGIVQSFRQIRSQVGFEVLIGFSTLNKKKKNVQGFLPLHKKYAGYLLNFQLKASTSASFRSEGMWAGAVMAQQ